MYLEIKREGEAHSTPLDPLSLPALIAWLETKPAVESYCYVENGRCLLAQYLTHIGWKNVRVLPSHCTAEGEYWEHPRSWERVSCRGPWTFGAALMRARAEQALQANAKD